MSGAAFFCLELEPPFCLEPESAPGPRTSGAGAAQKSGGSAFWAQYFSVNTTCSPELHKISGVKSKYFDLKKNRIF